MIAAIVFFVAMMGGIGGLIDMGIFDGDVTLKITQKEWEERLKAHKREIEERRS